MTSRDLNLDSNLNSAAWSTCRKGFICSEIPEYLFRKSAHKSAPKSLCGVWILFRSVEDAKIEASKLTNSNSFPQNAVWLRVGHWPVPLVFVISIQRSFKFVKQQAFSLQARTLKMAHNIFGVKYRQMNFQESRCWSATPPATGKHSLCIMNPTDKIRNLNSQLASDQRFKIEYSKSKLKIWRTLRVRVRVRLARYRKHAIQVDHNPGPVFRVRVRVWPQSFYRRASDSDGLRLKSTTLWKT